MTKLLSTQICPDIESSEHFTKPIFSILQYEGVLLPVYYTQIGITVGLKLIKNLILNLNDVEKH